MTFAAAAAYIRRMKGVAGVCLVCVAALAACGNSRSILYAGVSPGISGKRLVITDAAARRDARSDRRQWLAYIAQQARRDPRARFANLSTSEFRRRLDAAASKYGFTVETVRFLEPRQLAPLVVVRTSHYLAFSKAIPAIENSIDPGRQPPAFEALYLEGQDERGIPFVVVNNEFRGQVMGGQWARSEALYPFLHG